MARMASFVANMFAASTVAAGTISIYVWFITAGDNGTGATLTARLSFRNSTIHVKELSPLLVAVMTERYPIRLGDCYGRPARRTQQVAPRSDSECGVARNG